ncbi:MAG: YraN family protein [Candidatus Omnitrophota bacterium]
MHTNKALGRIGEETAAEFLRTKGYSILFRNWRCALGEIDIVARHRDYIVFVEIKARSSLDFGPGYCAVGSRKQRKLINLAQTFLKKYALRDVPCRIDIVSIDMDATGEPLKIELIEDAFWENER